MVQTITINNYIETYTTKKAVNEVTIYASQSTYYCARCKKDMKDNKDNSRHLRRKYARIFVLGHYLFLVAHSFPPQALLSENSALLGTDNVRRQISEHIFAPNGDYCLYIFAPNGGYCLFISRGILVIQE